MTPSRTPSDSATPLGRVLNIQRMSTDDGPGIRTTVFLKGCSLACTWCHNPESIAAQPEIVWRSEPCIGCRSCIEACPEGARSLDERGAQVAADRCRTCGTCADECPTAAIEVAGVEWTVNDLFREIGKDRAYFRASGGGVTLSGGEPLMQPRFAQRLLERCHDDGLHTALDTCGLCGREALLRVLPACDLVLYDLKEMDDGRHRELTGQSNRRVLDNLVTVASWLRDHGDGGALWIRTPLVPGATAREDNLLAIGEFIAGEIDGSVERWELCAFNNLCEDKYRRLGATWAFADTPMLTDAELARFAEVARGSGVDPARVHAGGPTRLARADAGGDDAQEERA
ncbi:MAG: glycyl-radical enzyme activating protein [Deltaproteobacteria bacterium]|jgi:pyruvate formate lyase activating enzyme|nr:glycyl-radical enzyme activating protein [Deltaproteobacteria bacterium]MBW2531061.1 glycyl-radical enzyme activating protein [Deltaproteobacteria bacterium]